MQPNDSIQEALVGYKVLFKAIVRYESQIVSKRHIWCSAFVVR